MARLARLLTLILVLTPATGTAQKHYLVSPSEEIIPLKPGEPAGDLVRQLSTPSNARATSACPDSGMYYPFEPWPVNMLVNAYHKDVVGQWYVAPAAGTIDSVFFIAGEHVAAYDSTVFLRIHRSIVGPEYGPGVRPGPFAPPCQPWGYWVNTNDVEQGVASFPEEATDTVWRSTYPLPGTPSTPPFGEELWGDGGYPLHVSANGINAFALAELEPLHVSLNDRFFISMRMAWDPAGACPHEHEVCPEEEPTQFGASSRQVSTSDEYYPSRNWKFYEHERTNGPSSCSGLPADSLRRGWYARGGWSGDSTEVVLWSIWYSMTVTENAPPLFGYQSELANTLDTGPRAVQATVVDCYSLNPALSGVASVMLQYEVDGVSRPPVTMAYIGADTWEGDLPGQDPGTRVTGRIETTDLEGATSRGTPFSYAVVPFGNEWYALDTGYACVPRDIRLTGTTLDTASLFLPPSAPFTASKLNDGTSGPYDLGGVFSLFGDWFEYAWIGVDGGIALTKTASETLDVNSNGLFLMPGELPWTVPRPQKHDRGTYTAHLMPGMFIAPFWADHILADTSDTYGRIVIGDAGDSCLFVAEWDSIGRVTASGPAGTATTFRVVLDRCTGAVEFQYAPGGNWSAYSQSFTGMQADSNVITGPQPGHILLGNDGHPPELAPADDRCIRLLPTVGFLALDGWNLVSVSHLPIDGDYRQSSLFPGTKPVWSWDPSPPGYAQPSGDPVMSRGMGYWMKCSRAGRVGSKAGGTIGELFIPVQDGWNLFGGVSIPISSHDVNPIPGAQPVSMGDIFAYTEHGYGSAELIEPGKAYWVHTVDVQALWMRSYAAVPRTDVDIHGEPTTRDLNSLRISDESGRSQSLYLASANGEREHRIDQSSFELPPPPPDGAFDVRFVTGRMLGVIGSVDGVSPPQEAVIAIRGARYPITVEWDITHPIPAPGRLLLAPAGLPPAADANRASGTPMDGLGSLTFDALPSGLLSVRLDGGSSVPTVFALGANYPNPFNPSTTFTVDIPLLTELRVEVVDILGRSVAELMNGPQPAGSHRLIWDGLDRNGVAAPSGVYIIRLTSANYNASRKALLVR